MKGYEIVSTHSHPKVAASTRSCLSLAMIRFNTQPPEGGCLAALLSAEMSIGFQHTATRRWLLHSLRYYQWQASFNTQPPEGGCSQSCQCLSSGIMFQHTATRRWLLFLAFSSASSAKFQHTATRRWLLIAIFNPYQRAMFQHTATRRWLRKRR